MSDSHSGVPNAKIIPPLVYLVGIVIGIVISIWIPIKIAPSSLAWTLGGILLICGAVLNGSAILKFKNVGTPFGLIAPPIRSLLWVPIGSLVTRCISDSLWFTLALH
jgi:hypothetical protein